MAMVMWFALRAAGSVATDEDRPFFQSARSQAFLSGAAAAGGHKKEPLGFSPGPGSAALPNFPALKSVSLPVTATWSGLLFALASTLSTLRGGRRAASRLRPGRRQGACRTVCCAAAQTAEETLAEAKAALEATKLELQATRLRAEAEALARENAKARRRVRAEQLMDGHTSLTVQVLQASLMAVLSIETSEEQVQRLITACRPAQSALQLEDLLTERFEEALNTLTAEVQAAKRQVQLAEREKALKEAEERRKARQEDAPAQVIDDTVNDDRGFGSRILACLPYLLPLLDGLQFGFPLVQLVPALTPVFAVLAVPAGILNAIPFGSLIVFILMSILATNKDIPRLVRFNLQQSILLDVALFIPSIIGGLLSLFIGGDGGIGLDLGVVMFILLTSVIGYCVSCSLLGKDPDGLPVFSAASRRSLDRNDMN